MSEIKTGATNLIPISWEILDQNLGQFLTMLPGLGNEEPTTDIEGISIFIQPVNNDNLYENQKAVLQSNFEYKLIDSYPSTWQDTQMYAFVGIDGNGQNIYISKEDIVNGDVLLQIADNDYELLDIQNSKKEEQKEEVRKEEGREEGREEGKRKLIGGMLKDEEIEAAKKVTAKAREREIKEDARRDLAACGAGTGMACAAVATAPLTGAYSGAASASCVGAACLGAATGALAGANSPEILQSVSNLDLSPSSRISSLHGPPRQLSMKRNGGKKTRKKKRRKKTKKRKRKKKRKTRRKKRIRRRRKH